MIRYIYMAVVVLSVCSLGYGQSANDLRLEQIENDIIEAVQEQDYEKAASLKKEKDIRIQIREAINNKDFDQAALLKEQLINSKTVPDRQTNLLPVQPEVKHRIAEVESSLHPKANTGENTVRLPLNNLTWYRANKSGFYVNSVLGAINHFGMGSSSGFGFGGGARIGSKFFFGNKEHRSRGGIDLMYFSVLGNDYGVQFGVANVGITWAGAFTRKSGIEFSLLGGANLFHNYFTINENTRMGVAIAPQMKFRFSFVDLGATVIYASAFGNNLESVFIGGVAGFKF